MSTLISILGIVVLLGIAFLLSNNHKAINFRTVLGALAIQIGIGALILYVPAGRDALDWLAGGIQKIINYGNEGISFLFGGLVSDKMFEVFGGGGGFVFAVTCFTDYRFLLCLNFIALLHRCDAMDHQNHRGRFTKTIRYFKSRVYVCCG
ncbi:hypothetical protein GEW_07918 [Pasteurella multocida subsp. gallicida str. Anand1_poultry]|nr:hypothetical protein GEW_07918 [Pasteurella multocida subsp. gallicida str. Anand1_poultry]